MKRFASPSGLTRAVALAALALVLFAASAPGQKPTDDPRQILPMDTGWKFMRGDLPGGQEPPFPDSAWTTLNVPHDWSIAGPFSETNRTGGAGGFLPAGIGWYRKHFVLPADFAARRVFIEFDGVMAHSEVWINGTSLGKRPNGYVSFRYELTGHLAFGPGKTNVLAVRADNSEQPASRWYAGAGIYRHVRLVATDPVHLEAWSTFVSTPKAAAADATAHVQTTVVNQSETARELTVQCALLPPGENKEAGHAETPPTKVPPGGSAELQLDILVKQPLLWDLEHPHLYRAVTTVHAGGKTIDNEATVFGIRDARFEAATGFWLNEHNLKLKGVCLHHDAGGLGAAVPLRAWERRLEILRSLGVNSIRTAHNPPAPEFLDLCDRMGFLVMDEMFDCWTVAKNRYDYHLDFNEWSKIDTRDTVRRDRNHPSIVVYSAGNEIHDTPKADLAKTILRGLVEVFHQNDPTRPVSQALFRPNVSHDYDNGLADLLDVVGQNYRENEILAAHEQNPARKILGSENGHDRRVWLALRDHAPYAGQFLWSGIDYLGESRRWPVVGAGSGLLDRVGTPRARGFERQSWWSAQPMVHLVRRSEPAATTSADPGFEPLRRPQVEFADWTPRNTEPHDETVEAYSNCDEVELFLNDKSLGAKSLPADASSRVWKIPFQPGTLKAVGKNKGQPAASHELRTAGKPAKILLAAGRSTLATVWDDVCYVQATVTDAQGIPVPGADDPITFEISGAGLIAAVDSGDNSNHEPFQAKSRRAYQGLCYAILKATAPSGQIHLTASAPGLASSSFTIQGVSEKK